MTEKQHQINLFKWSRQPSIRQQYPELMLLFHVPNETKDEIERKQKMMMGMKRGVPDLFLPVPTGQYHGLYIELKAEGGTVSNDQYWWIDHLKANGYACFVSYGWKHATEVLEWYLNLKRE